MPPLALPSDAFHLGDLVVVPSLNRLVRGGRTEDVEPRVMRVLAALAATPGEVVTRAALFEAVWSDTVVNDESLTRAVSELRKALGPEASGAIETIRGTGYRLALPTAPLTAEPLATGLNSAAAPAVPRPPVAAASVPAPRAARGGPLVVLALLLAGLSLAVAMWAAWPRETPEAASELLPTRADHSPEARLASPEPIRLDSTSPYYRSGMSELGVYYDSTADAYFQFVEEDE